MKLLVLVLALVLAPVCGFAQNGGPKGRPFAVGQVWSQKPPADFRIKITSLEVVDGNSVILVSLLDVPCLPTMGCTTFRVGNSPYAEPTLRAAVDELLRVEKPDPDSARLRNEWAAGTKSYFTIPPHEVSALLTPRAQPRRTR